MLDNMINNPFPTKAEALDIFNSVAEGATATMLSGETAVGKYPIKLIRTMAKIANRVFCTLIFKIKNMI